LIDAWQAFTQTIEQSLPRLYQVLKTHQPEKRSEQILVLKLDNISQQKDFMEKVHSKLMGALKKSLNNYQIELTVEVLEEISNQQLVYTASDKFNYLAEQNELLHKLKQNFNLDLE
jgi:DNA polymerase-3 subunit gamma/tau